MSLIAVQLRQDSLSALEERRSSRSEKREAERWPYAKAVSIDVFCEPSAGAADFSAFVNTLKNVHDDGWGIVEQDMYPAPFEKPFPIAKGTRTYLRSLGL